MNFQWMNQNAACPVVEFHDLRTEKFRADRYLALIENRFAPALTAAGVATLGQFRVENHPDRLVLLRGFAGMAARRKALTAFHQGPDWTAQRAESASLLKDQQVMLTRSIVPADGMRPIRRDERLTLVISELRFPEQVGNYHLWLRCCCARPGSIRWQRSRRWRRSTTCRRCRWSRIGPSISPCCERRSGPGMARRAARHATLCPGNPDLGTAFALVW